MIIRRAFILVLLSATFLSGCGSSIKKADLIGYWQGVEVIKSSGEKEQVRADKQDMIQIEEGKLITLSITSGSFEEKPYSLEGNVIRVEGKEFLIVEAVSPTELRLKAGKDSSPEAGYEGASIILKKIAKQDFESAKRP